jgi:threonine dehydrogenase-like Zn-dependent dehydrogenase
VRKLEIELGESAMVMGLGLLGIFAVQFCRLSGANPVIAADLNPERREVALKLGADYAFDPSAPDFADQVKAVTGGKGVRATVEVTGVSAAMKQAIKCASISSATTKTSLWALYLIGEKQYEKIKSRTNRHRTQSRRGKNACHPQVPRAF